MLVMVTLFTIAPFDSVLPFEFHNVTGDNAFRLEFGTIKGASAMRLRFDGHCCLLTREQSGLFYIVSCPYALTVNAVLSFHTIDKTVHFVLQQVNGIRCYEEDEDDVGGECAIDDFSVSGSNQLEAVGDGYTDLMMNSQNVANSELCTTCQSHHETTLTAIKSSQAKNQKIIEERICRSYSELLTLQCALRTEERINQMISVYETLERLERHLGNEGAANRHKTEREALQAPSKSILQRFWESVKSLWNTILSWCCCFERKKI
jgi:hypothetical protein